MTTMDLTLKKRLDQVKHLLLKNKTNVTHQTFLKHFSPLYSDKFINELILIMDEKNKIDVEIKLSDIHDGFKGSTNSSMESEKHKELKKVVGEKLLKEGYVPHFETIIRFFQGNPQVVHPTEWNSLYRKMNEFFDLVETEILSRNGLCTDEYQRMLKDIEEIKQLSVYDSHGNKLWSVLEYIPYHSFQFYPKPRYAELFHYLKLKNKIIGILGVLDNNLYDLSDDSSFTKQRTDKKQLILEKTVDVLGVKYLNPHDIALVEVNLSTNTDSFWNTVNKIGKANKEYTFRCINVSDKDPSSLPSFVEKLVFP